MSEASQLSFLLYSTVVGCCVLGTIAVALYALRVYGTGSTHLTHARASTNLALKLRTLVGPGVEILMPAGCGRYPLAGSDGARSKWELRIEKWLKLGVRLTVIITQPNGPAEKYWTEKVERFSLPNFRVCVLDRQLAAPDDALEIARLDTFHPTLVLKNNAPLAMWIEGYHPPDSRTAYNVEYVYTTDLVGFQRARFDKFLRVLRRLTDDRAPSPYLRVLSSAVQLQEKAA